MMHTIFVSSAMKSFSRKTKSTDSVVSDADLSFTIPNGKV